MIVHFPDPRDATPEGIVAVGGTPDPDYLAEAYSRGIFPWPVEGYALLWFCPPERAVLIFDELHVPRSLARERRRTHLRFTTDRAFERVIRACASVERAHEKGTWITHEMIDGYCEFQRRGHAHSVEAWEGEELVGGLYGVDAGGAFAGESMFHFRPNASKLALLFLIDHLRTRGLDWLDIQVLTPHLEALGARLITREEFLERLARARRRGLKLF
ncbi:MAG: leucyl/phenylalanyl-tRNA---protein transferase [Acidobacteriota bacterium]|jgi:leucyl/phenylalanyl-tRNA--protein transferase|nr:leucyl/phenylalanyl-tRNA---protein transferase [Acidobacteriota bacterium]MDT5261081.1 leucyl/phenylalanyl-tRNA---protein transferase [Acidobacteriota bacterium]